MTNASPTLWVSSIEQDIRYLYRRLATCGEKDKERLRLRVEEKKTELRRRESSQDSP